MDELKEKEVKTEEKIKEQTEETVEEKIEGLVEEKTEEVAQNTEKEIFDNNDTENKDESSNQVKTETKVEEVIENTSENIEEVKAEAEANIDTKFTVVNDTKENDDEDDGNKVVKAIRTCLQSIFQTRAIVVLVGIALLLKTVLLYKTQIFKTEPLKPEYIQMATAFICVILTLPMLLKDKARFWIAMLINLLVSILLCVNDLYYSYSSNLVSISQISNLQYGREISIALPNLVHIGLALYFIDIIAVLVLFLTFRIKIKKHSYKAYIVGIIYLLLMIFLVCKPIAKWIEKAEEYQYNKIQQIEASSIYGYHFIDLRNNIDMKKNVKYKSKNDLMKAYGSLKDKYTDKYVLEYDLAGIAKDKNVIIVQLESVQNFVVNRKINGKEITPNLNRFLNENIEFTNMQNQSYSSTSDSEFAVMNSIYPLENGMCFAQYPSNDYDNMYNEFKGADYTTTYIHGNNGAFWNRQAVYSRLKIDNLLFDNVFDSDVERISNYVSDEAVYRKIVDEMKNYDGKFMVNIVAASSHTAFDLPGIQDKDKKVNLDVGDEYRGIYFGNYLEAMNYADYSFGIFIDELKKAGLYDDSVILVYGDHAGLQMYNWEMQDFIKEVRPLNDIQTQINYSNVLCGLKIPGVDSMKINKPVSKVDVKPTLMEICGIEDTFSLGQSMFSNKDFVCLNNGKIITDKYFYDGDWYLIESGEKLDLSNLPEAEVEKLNDYCESLKTELDISLSINILNLLKK